MDCRAPPPSSHAARTQLLAHATRRDLGASILFRYVGGIGAGALFYFLRDRLPFPHPELSILFGAFVAYNTLLIPTLLFADRLPIRLLFLVPAYLDVAVAFVFVHFTGGYLSPFLVTPLLSVIGINLVYLTDRRTGAGSFVLLAAALVGMTVTHRTGWLPVPVPYAARLIADDAFFYATFPPVLLLFTLGWYLARTTGGSVYVTITDLLTTNQRLVERMASQAGHGGREEFLRLVAESFGGDRAFVVPLPGTSEVPVPAHVWPAGAWSEPAESLSGMAPALRALAQGTCLVPYGAGRAFPECAVVRRTGTEGCWVTVLRDEREEPVGVLGVLRAGPLQLDHKAAFLMRLFSVLAQAGLQQERAERATAAMREQLNHARKMEALGQLAGGVAHDFNNLLTVILGVSELMRARLDSQPLLSRYASDIHAAGQRAADLVRHMLSFARRAPVKLAPVDLHDLLREVERLLAHTLDKRIELALELVAPYPTLLGDASQLQNALLNVALNARDAMPDGGQLVISTANRELGPEELALRAPGAEPGTFVEIVCRDTGTGMEKEVLASAFDPFFTTKPPGKGTGLGLAAVYGCVRAHGGFTEIDSAPGAGTRVHILLPASRVAVQTSSTGGPASRAVATTTRLLVAEDEELVAGLIRRALEPAGYEVEVCPDGAAAVERFRQAPSRYALVLLDVMMPKLDGRQAFEAMKQLDPELRCVFVSGYCDDARIGPLLAAARCGFVQKPFSVGRLLEAIRAELDAAPRTSRSLGDRLQAT